MKKRQKLLTEEQWELIEPLLPRPRRRRDKRGRPPAGNRACFEGILWVLQTGAAWRFLPDEFPSPSTCWRRLQRWQEEGVWLDAWRALLGGLDGEGLLRGDETFLGGSFAPAKKGASPSVKPSGARERSGWYWQTVGILLVIDGLVWVVNPLRPYLYPNAHLGFLFPVSFVELILPVWLVIRGWKIQEPTERHAAAATSADRLSMGRS